MDEIARLYPPPPEYFETTFYEEPETIARKQLARLQDRAQRAYQIPFHRRRWDEAGFHPDHLRTLDDLWKAPMYTVDDIRASIDAHPPLGDYQAFGLDDARREPMRVYMSGGTTGASRPTLYTAWDRMAGAVFTARALYTQGIRPGDTVLNAWAYSTHNGAHCFDEALYDWLNCVVLTTGTGNVTSSAKQIELARTYGATAILTTGDYMLRLAEVAQEMGYDPEEDFAIRSLPNIGDSDLLRETWGPTVLQSYGFHEVQWVSTECPVGGGLHIYEDGFIVQIVDVETGEPLPDGETGSICITELYKTGTAQFRYNILDLSYLEPPGQCECGSWLRKMGTFAGRGDNMVKLRGVNMWPEALGEVATAVPGVEPDYFVRAYRDANRDEMLVSVTSREPESEFPALAENVAGALRDLTGVKINAEVVPAGGLDSFTGMDRGVAKAVRFKDERS